MTKITPLNTAFVRNLQTLQKTQKLIDITTLRLATGLDVNSALDDPKNFFDARALQNRASDLSQRLDGIGKGIRTIQEGLIGTQAIEELLRLSEGNLMEELDRFKQFGPLPPPPPVTITTTVTTAGTPLDTEILADNPTTYWRLNETSGATAATLGSAGSVAGTYQNGPTLNAAPLYPGADGSVDFNGTNQYVSIPNSTEINSAPHVRRSIELVFNADTTSGRQVLYEEGATVNSLTIYIDNGRVYVTGRDSGAWGPANISAPIVPGQTYHVGFSMDAAAGEFIGYLDGLEIGRDTVTATFPSHTGAIAIGRMSGGAWFHDGSESGNGNYFNGRISDVALYNATLSPADFTARASSVIGTTTSTGSFEVTPPIQLQALNDALDQIDQITKDANYRGINLLRDENLLTLFNETGSSSLLSEGVDFRSQALGILRIGFETQEGIERIIQSVRASIAKVRRYSESLTFDLNILKTRQIFTQNTVNTLISGAQDLTLADTNEEGANLLALQTRQALGVTALSLASQGNSALLDIFT